ncbi:hypothetical protein [Jeotgalibacillus proteolyticus]|uniref:Uncharacterized protein n=1 Tax=Jeotgalibacillus proteolyticus TaxID=2082395 RepID=A0A2S5GCK2_9BACL|nr:hypothetical protein [Jeotgalibacillus proteolyticus]PPA70726.1 hypothetical protein C4B60_07985 [Jeotgalibacillus proteolyticus]
MNTFPETMTKIEKLDFLISREGNLTSAVLQKMVKEIFTIDIFAGADHVEQKEALDKRLEQLEDTKDGEEVRKLINELLRINLDGVASLERARISLFSKGQWISKNDTDLFVIFTGENDVDVEINTSPYFVEKENSKTPPVTLVKPLSELGYVLNSEKNKLVYHEPNGKPVTDSFKGQTISSVVQVIQQEYSHY